MRPLPQARTAASEPDRAIAVAVAYDPATADLPKVVAGGRGAIADQILNIAFANGIRVREDADLAELLAAVDIDADIPPAALAAIAEILVYVWRANQSLPPQDSEPWDTAF